MIRTLSLIALIGAPAFAQDADPNNQLVEGFMACVSAGGDLTMTQALLEAAQWTRSEDFEDGLIYFFPGTGEDSFVYMAKDESFCHVESTSVGSADTSNILVSLLEAPEGVSFVTATDEMGCVRLDLETGVTATITSGGNDPMCESQSNSAVRFDFSKAE